MKTRWLAEQLKQAIEVVGEVIPVEFLSVQCISPLEQHAFEPALDCVDQKQEVRVVLVRVCGKTMVSFERLLQLSYADMNLRFAGILPLHHPIRHQLAHIQKTCPE